MPHFQRFRRGMAPVGAQAFVTIQSKGPLSLNRAAFEALGRPEKVALLYDPEERIVGLEKVAADSLDAYPVRAQAGNNWLVAGQAFTKFYGIDTSIARRFKAEVIEGGILAFDLKGEWMEATSPRQRNAADAQARLALPA
jgi:hypothetical protein